MKKIILIHFITGERRKTNFLVYPEAFNTCCILLLLHLALLAGGVLEGGGQKGSNIGQAWTKYEELQVPLFDPDPDPDPDPELFRLENRGVAASITNFFSGLFNGKDDPCEEYYRAALVDPAFEVCLIIWTRRGGGA